LEFDLGSRSEILTLFSLLNKHRGKEGHVQFTKKNGDLRKMRFKQGVIGGVCPLQGRHWANTPKIKAEDYSLALVTDLDKEEAGEHSRRSIPLDRVEELTIAGETYTRGKNGN